MDPLVQHMLNVSEEVMLNLVKTQNERNEVVVEGLISVVKQLNESIGALNKTIVAMGEVAGKVLRGELKGDHHSRDVLETMFQRWVKASSELVDDCRQLTAPIIKIADKE